MALDNRARMSVSCHWVPAFPVGVRPIGSLTARSRQASGWMYAGVTLDTPTDEAAVLDFQHFDRYRDRRFTEFYPEPKGRFDF